MKLYLVIIASIVLLTGCAPKMVALQNKFDPNLTKSLIEKDGNNTLDGNAFLRQNSGAVITCAGSEVLLIPVTQYSIERTSVIFGNSYSGFFPIQFDKKIQFDNNPELFVNLMKRERCDSQGNFSFGHVGDG